MNVARKRARWGIVAAAQLFCSGLFAIDAGAQDLSIVSPYSGMSVQPGQQISVAAQAANGFTPVLATAATPGLIVPMTVPGLTASITAPTGIAGATTLWVDAADANGNVESAQVTLYVVSSAALQSISVTPPRLDISGLASATPHLVVTGSYSDGSMLDLTSSTTGTFYSSDTQSVATVDSDGNLTAVGMGYAGITVSNGGFEVLARVKVSVQPGVLVASVLPSSRSVEVGSPATAFATVINTGQDATGCAISPSSTVPAAFSFQATNGANQLTGTPNAPVTIQAGAAQSFVFSFTPTGPFGAQDLPLLFLCANTTAAPVFIGLDTLLLSGSTTPVPDVIALAATLSNDGIVDIPGVNSSGVFVVATENIGVGATIIATADTGTASLPISLALCQTDPTSGGCISAIGPSVTTTMNGGSTQAFGIFVTATDQIPFAPATSRIFVRFKDTAGTTRGSTSVAVQTQ